MNKHVESKENLVQAIKASHAKTEHATRYARAACDAAIACNLETCALVESLQRKSKHTLKTELAPVMTGDKVAGYMTLSRISKKRELRRDKKQLELVGLIDKQVRNVAVRVAPVKTCSTIMTRASRELAKKLRDRPVAAWSVEEKENFKRSLAPYLEMLKESQE